MQLLKKTQKEVLEDKVKANQERMNHLNENLVYDDNEDWGMLIMIPVVSETFADRMKLIENIVIPYPKFNGVLCKIKECHEKSVILKVPPSLLITGEVGSGKTFIFERYLKQNYKEWEEEEDDGIRFKKTYWR